FRMLGILFDNQNFLRMMCEDVFDLLKDVLHLFKGKRLIDKIDRTFQETFRLYLMRRHDVYGDMAGSRIALKFFHNIPTALYRKLNIQQDAQGPVLPRKVNGLVTSHRNNCLVSTLSRIV